MRRSGATIVMLILALAGPLTACEALSDVAGLAKIAKEIGKHLEKDLQSELTDAKIDKVLEVTPKLREFSKESKTKWELDPQAPDFTKLASAMGAMSDYAAFFESHGTRLTEYYVDTVKIADARAHVQLQRAHAEALRKHEEERTKLEAELAAAADDGRADVETKLERNAAAKKKLEEAHQASLEMRKKRREAKDNQYKLSDEEIARVEARLDEIDAIFDEKKNAPAGDEKK